RTPIPAQQSTSAPSANCGADNSPAKRGGSSAAWASATTATACPTKLRTNAARDSVQSGCFPPSGIDFDPSLIITGFLVPLGNDVQKASTYGRNRGTVRMWQVTCQRCEGVATRKRA